MVGHCLSPSHTLTPGSLGPLFLEEDTLRVAQTVGVSQGQPRQKAYAVGDPHPIFTLVFISFPSWK